MILNHSNGINNLKAIRKILDDVPLLLRRFSSSEIRNFLSIGHIEHYSRGDIIVKETEKSNKTAYLTADGKLTIWYKNIHLADIQIGDFIGEPFLYGKSDRSATVIAEQPSVVIRFERQETLEFFRQQPERLFKVFIMNIMEVQHNKIVSMNKKMIKLQQHLIEKNKSRRI